MGEINMEFLRETLILKENLASNLKPDEDNSGELDKSPKMVQYSHSFFMSQVSGHSSSDAPMNLSADFKKGEQMKINQKYSRIKSERSPLSDALEGKILTDATETGLAAPPTHMNHHQVSRSSGNYYPFTKANHLAYSEVSFRKNKGLGEPIENYTSISKLPKSRIAS